MRIACSRPRGSGVLHSVEERAHLVRFFFAARFGREGNREPRYQLRYQVGVIIALQQTHVHYPLADVVAFPEISSVVLSKPTLEDVFIARTGHRFEEVVEESP